jgi:hypothetical protein
MANTVPRYYPNAYIFLRSKYPRWLERKLERKMTR